MTSMKSVESHYWKTVLGYKVFGFQDVVALNKTSHRTLFLALSSHGALINQRRNSYSGQYKSRIALTRTPNTFVVQEPKLSKSGISFLYQWVCVTYFAGGHRQRTTFATWARGTCWVPSTDQTRRFSWRWDLLPKNSPGIEAWVFTIVNTNSSWTMWTDFKLVIPNSNNLE